VVQVWKEDRDTAAASVAWRSAISEGPKKSWKTWSLKECNLLQTWRSARNERFEIQSSPSLNGETESSPNICFGGSQDPQKKRHSKTTQQGE